MRTQTIFRRREFKYLITPQQQSALLAAIGDRIRPDKFGRSTICNLYFDTPDYLLIRRSIEHPVYKEKLRLRSYGPAAAGGRIYAEIKKKYKGVVYKRRESLPSEEEVLFLTGEHPQDTQIGREIGYFFRRYRDLKPRVHLSYERQAYDGVDDYGFRITFDDHITARTDRLTLTEQTGGRELLPPDKILMEVKCAGAMPLWMARLLSREHIYKTSYSKYGTAYELLINQSSGGKIYV